MSGSRPEGQGICTYKEMPGSPVQCAAEGIQICLLPFPPVHVKNGKSLHICFVVSTECASSGL